MSDATDAAPGLERPSKLLSATFIATIALFLVLAALVFLQQWIPYGRLLSRYLMLPGAAALVVLGLALLVLAMRSRLERGLRRALILTGIAALGAPVGAILHNLTYALLVLLSERGIWKLKEGGDEGVFFLLAVVAFPVLFIVSAAFGAVLMWRTKAEVRGWRA
jgi:hypothetical protein